MGGLLQPEEVSVWGWTSFDTIRAHIHRDHPRDIWCTVQYAQRAASNGNGDREFTEPWDVLTRSGSDRCGVAPDGQGPILTPVLLAIHAFSFTTTVL